MPTKDIVVVGTSSGGIEALQTLVAGLPRDFAAAMFIVMHTSPAAPGVLQAILDPASPLRVSYPADNARSSSERLTKRKNDHDSCVARFMSMKS